MLPAPRTALLAVLLAAAACARSKGGDGSAAPSATPAPRRRSDVITRAQIDSTNFASVFDLVAALRGNWLNVRGPDSINNAPSEVQVHIDDMRAGGIAALRTIHPNDVTQIQHFDGIAASGRWGLGYTAGAIQVVTRRR